jgi:hypothetical protein
MKKTVYIAPATEIVKLQAQQLLNTISNPQTVTGAEGLGISTENYEDEGRSRRSSLWDDDDEE